MLGHCLTATIVMQGDVNGGCLGNGCDGLLLSE